MERLVGEEEITEEQRKRAEANRAAALAKRKAILSLNQVQDHTTNPFQLFKCRKVSSNPTTASFAIPKNPPIEKTVGPPQKFRARLEIYSPDSFSVTPVAVAGFTFAGEELCFQKLRDCLSNVELSHYTQRTGGGKACVFRLGDYQLILRSLKNCKGIECEEIPWGTFNVIERLSHSFIAGKWIPCRPEYLPDEKVDELIAELPETLLNALLPFQLDGVRFGVRRGGRCLIADEMGLGKTLQAISIAGCFRKEGSILVVCPAILRYSWAEELERWFPYCLPNDIHLVFGHHDDPARLPRRPKVVVISYTMLRRLQKSMLEQEWITLIVDESHHLHCTKKSSENDELKAVLDVAVKAKHLILLSGTPSLSRPYDIFHQVNLLWPGLLGQTKYDFAKTYCSVKFVKGYQGKVFQDFSKGIRLEELNILLKQSVMIRRLKEHVMPQLPPKRRQIINLVLKRSDVNLAMETLGLGNGDASADSDDETVQQETFEEDEDSHMNKKLSQRLSALGIAKLPGFFEWLSIHPIMSDLDGEETWEGSPRSQKMIVFSYHHKVLDGVQAFLCEKGIQFVRIDCSVTGTDRQSAVQTFQFSKEVRIALIGIRSGGSGLTLTAADSVVFLELPLRPADIQQAEDRAHRHGQKKLVNIYIFCAKDTVDELHWRRLNKSLLRVSSTVNGKRDAIREIEIESVSYLERTRIASEKIKQSITEPTEYNDKLVARFMKSQNSSLSQYSLPIGLSGDSNVAVNVDGELNECNAISSCRSELCPEVDSIATEIILKGGECINEVESGVNCSVQATPRFRFEVSRYTGRIHLYSCVPGIDLRPKPLFENFRQEEVEFHEEAVENERMTDISIKDNQIDMKVLMTFITEWKKLRPVEKKKLIGKPLQLPLSYELCYLNESLNHKDGGLLRGGSKRRKTPRDEISCPLPSNASRRKVNICSGHGQKENHYSQGWSDMDEPLCKLCQIPCKNNNAKAPQFFEDLFCSLDCFEEYRSRTSSRYLREELFKIENGICTICRLDCHRLVEHLRPLSLEMRRSYVKKEAPNIAKRSKLLDKLVCDPTEGNVWHADHIIPVYKGGGECKLENMRTLCVACHADVTTAQCTERRIARNKAKKKLKDMISGDEKKLGQTNHFQKLDHKKEEDDDLIIEIPGSAYSGAEYFNRTTDRNQEQELLINDNCEAPKLVQVRHTFDQIEASEVTTGNRGCEEERELLNPERDEAAVKVTENDAK